MDAATREVVGAALNSGYNVTFAGSPLTGANDVCHFIESGSLAVAWDGRVASCLALLHDHVSYLHGQPRHSAAHTLGLLGAPGGPGLAELWADPAYVAYSERVRSFAFAPCTCCGGCDRSQDNQADCIGNTFPACGGCLWAQGVIQCP